MILLVLRYLILNLVVNYLAYYDNVLYVANTTDLYLLKCDLNLEAAEEKTVELKLN